MLNGRVTGRYICAMFLMLVFSGGLQRLAAQATPDFSVSPTPLAPSPVTAGATATSTVTVTASNGFNGLVTLTSICPTGATCTLTPPTVTPSASGVLSSLTVVPTTSTPVPSNVTVTGTSGSLTHAVPVALSVGTTTTSTSDTLKNDFGFGVALGLTANATGPSIVTSAIIDANGIVRVNTRANTTAGFMLETHYFIWPPPPKLDATGTAAVDNRSWGIGPFVAAQPGGSSQIIQSVGAGLMVGFRRPKGSIPTGFGLGFGYEAIPSAQVLGSEFVNGKPAPVGPTGAPLPIRFETEDKGALLVVFSVTF